MKLLLLTVSLAVAASAWTSLAAQAAPADPPRTPAADDPAQAGQAGRAGAVRGATTRVGGDRSIAVKTVGDRYTSGPCSVDAPLPDGYPAPTPPGAIERKSYPAVRRAEVSGRSNPDAGRYLAFWPLFNHIKSRNIAMTAPVEVDYAGMTSESTGQGWTMSFLYRHRSQGEIGTAGPVRVKDAPAVQVLALGLKGVYDANGAKQALAQLERWLAENPEWEAAGSPRALFYNGPMKRAADRWSEIQIPIRPAAGTERQGRESKPAAPADRSL